MDSKEPTVHQGHEVRNMSVLNERVAFRASALAVFASILWGGNAVSIKIALAGVPPFALAAVRFFLGSIIVGLFNAATKTSIRLRVSELKKLFALLTLFVVQITTLNFGTRLTYAGHASLLISTYPLFTALFAHFFLPGDKLTMRKIAGLMLSFSGVVLIFAGKSSLGDFNHLPGDLLAILSGLLLGIRQVYTKRLTQRMPPSKLLFWQGIFSIPVFLGLSVIFERGISVTLSGAIFGAALYQGLIVAGFCFLLWTHLLRRHTASNLTVFSFITPISGVLLSGLLLSETISPILIISMALVGSGIIVVNLKS